MPPERRPVGRPTPLNAAELARVLALLRRARRTGERGLVGGGEGDRVSSGDAQRPRDARPESAN